MLQEFRINKQVVIPLIMSDNKYHRPSELEFKEEYSIKNYFEISQKSIQISRTRIKKLRIELNYQNDLITEITDNDEDEFTDHSVYNFEISKLNHINYKLNSLIEINHQLITNVINSEIEDLDPNNSQYGSQLDLLNQELLLNQPVLADKDKKGNSKLSIFNITPNQYINRAISNTSIRTPLRSVLPSRPTEKIKLPLEITTDQKLESPKEGPNKTKRNLVIASLIALTSMASLSLITNNAKIIKQPSTTELRK